MTRVLIIGGDGLLGRALRSRLVADGIEVIATSRRADAEFRVDLAGEPDRWPGFPAVDAAVLCAAVTSLAACRADPVGTARVNVRATAEVARRLVAVGALPLLLSSTQVFDGSEPRCRTQDRPRPVTEYGRQKAAAEAEVLGLGGAVVRLSKVLEGSAALLRDWAVRLRRGEPIVPFSDMTLAPISPPFAVGLIRSVVTKRVHGILHGSGDSDVSYAVMAGRLAAAVGADPRLVRPESARETRPDLESVPVWSSLAMGQAESQLGWEPQSSAAVIDAACAEAAASSSPSHG
ncbi:MAG: sugar nucleotide-binding protein [Alphaproteobacteria bacterium]